MNEQFKGLVFYLKDGAKDWYDPVDKEQGLTETEDKYIVDNTHAIYEIDKDSVLKFEWYDICEKCGRELTLNKSCEYCK